jgi:hypothetical protein
MDVVTFENVVVEGDASSGGGTNVTCLFVDGYVNTIVGTSLRLHNAKYGLFVSNGLSSTSSCPQFMNLFDVEAEQFIANALVINAGKYFKFVGCDFNNLSGTLGTSDTQAVVIGPNTGKILTQSMQFDACRFGNCQQNGMYINAIDITLTNCSFSDTSKAGTGTFPAINIDSLSSSVILTNIICQEYSTSYYPSNGVYINSGANNIIIDNLDATLCRDVAVYNNGATNVSVGQVTQPTGYTNGGTGGFVIKLANGDYYDFVYQSGVYCVTETQSTGCTAILMAGAGQTAVVSQIGSNFSNSSGSGNFRFFSSSTNHYRIQNNSGSAATFSIQSMQLRNAS